MRIFWVLLFCGLALAEIDEATQDELTKQELKEEAAIDADDIADEKLEKKSIPTKENPCANHKCGWGKECALTAKSAEPYCRCAEKCPTTLDHYVCSSHNATFGSICELYRERCFCKEGDSRCTDTANAKVHLEYMGKCRKLDDCTEEMMEQFPGRMADWLFEVMKDRNTRNVLESIKWEELANQAESDVALRHVYPVIWKYCQLNSRPHDNHVSHHELIPLIAPVLKMESCIKPFLKSCDKDDDRKITLKEWSHCLGLKDGEFEDNCD